MNKKNINKIIISPDTIGINKKNFFNSYSINLFDLFPYYNLDHSKNKFNSISYLSPENPQQINQINSTILSKDSNIEKLSKSEERNINTKSFLWNIGVLIYELYFGESPIEKITFEKEKKIVLKKLKQSESKDFDDLVVKLLIIDKDKRLNWVDYIHHEFFLTLKPDNVYQILYNKKINELDERIDLFSSEIYDDNIEILSKINFKNLLIFNLANNNIENVEFFSKDIFKNLKILILEQNNINIFGSKTLSKNLINLECLLLNSNFIYDDALSFLNMELNNLRYLSLSKNKITNILHLSECNLINLNTLNLSDNKINNISSLEKMNFPYLQELQLKNNQISNINVFEKTNFPILKILLLNNNKIENIDVFKKKIFNKLEILNLEDNKITDINCLKNVCFQLTLKELYLFNNPINYYEYLNLSYFPSLKISNLSLSDKNLKILSIKLKLYGYNMKNQNNNISVLFVPFELIKNKNYESLDYTNSFKILVNKNNEVEEIKQFFFKSVLEINHYYENEIQKIITIIKLFEGNTDDNRINDYTIFAYLDPKKIIKTKNNINSFFLINEYNIFHEKKNKFNKIPNYINTLDDIHYLNIKCPEKNKKNDENSFPQLIDEKELISNFLDNNYYYNKFPLIYINSQYYEGFLQYLKNNKKYQIYKDILGFKKMLISSKNKINFSHSENKNIIVEVVENIDFYSYEDISQIINSIKNSMKGNYINIINNYIMAIFDLLSECLLFILKLKVCYCICPDCNKSILFIDSNEKNKNNNQINQEEKDITLNKSIKICNNIFKCLISAFDSSNYINYKNLYFQNKNIHIPGCPPKKKKFINVIYHDENYEDFYSYISSDARQFKEATNGTFVFSNTMKSFETIMNGINKDINNPNKKFLLITTGSTFIKVHQFLKDNNYLNYISDIIIYCMLKSKYENLLKNPQEYPKLKGIFTTPEEVINFIEENSSENNKIFQLIKLVSYKDYIHEYYKLHNIIAEYYINTKKNTYDYAIALVKELTNENDTENYNELFEGLKTFETNKDYEVITEYTSNRIYKQLNGWLLNLQSEAYEKIAYFIGILMYKLNDYGIKNKKMNTNNYTLYRGICISYLDALSYQIYKGKKICIQTFFSTSKNIEVAQGFSLGCFDTEEEKRKNYHFSTLFHIKNEYKKDLYPLCFDISGTSNFDEEEFLFHPFTFFRIEDVKIDFNEFKLSLTLKAINKKEMLERKMNENNLIKYNKKENLMEINNLNNNKKENDEKKEEKKIDNELGKNKKNKKENDEKKVENIEESDSSNDEKMTEY